MSRYILEARNPKHTVVVGWDNMLVTFFAQVRDVDADEEADPILWLGAAPPPIHDLEFLKRLLAPYVIIPYVIQMKLLNDSD